MEATLAPPAQPTTLGTVMIVDDTPANLAVLSDALQEQGYRVLVATDGYSALEQLRYIKPDVILLDGMMPGMDGFETCRRIKEDRETQNIPILFMTALGDIDNLLRGFSEGAIDYIVKPFRHEEVLARVGAQVAQRRLIVRVEQIMQRSSNPWDLDTLRRDLGLTAREAEILMWVSRGKTNRDIGQILDTSPRTVNKHLEHIFDKLGVGTRSAAVSVALHHLKAEM